MARDGFLTNATNDLPETGANDTPRQFKTYTFCRTREQRRSSLGAEAVASGSRDGRAWEQRRSRLGRDTLERGATFADKSYLY